MLPALVLLSLATLSAFAIPSRQSSTPSVGSANSTIAWFLCPDTANDAYNTTFYCASHKVPLNWVDPSDGNQADLYLRMLPVAEGVERRGSLVSRALEIGPPVRTGSAEADEVSVLWVADSSSSLADLEGATLSGSWTWVGWPTRCQEGSMT